MTTGSSISSKLSLSFSKFSLGATDFLGDGPIILDYMVLVLDILQKNYLFQIQFKHLVVQSNSKSLLVGKQ